MQTIALPFRPVFEARVTLRQSMARGWRRHVAAAVLALALLGGAYAIVLAQVSGDRGIAPTAASADIEIRGIEVDVTGKNAEDARQNGWRLAQRLAWEKAGGPELADGQLSGLVSSIVIQREQIGPARYIATLGVIFDRQRAGRYLGGATRARSSAPMLVIPVMVSAGAYTSFEARNPWQRAWAEFNPGTSRIDYVRPSGAGGDSLLLNFGQTKRRSRTWWRSTLDQYGAADVIIPTVRLQHQFPGGPITASFTARYGPDSAVLDSFTLTAESPGTLPKMLDDGALRMDALYEDALDQGKLRPDPTLRLGASGEIDPALQRLIDIGRAVAARNRAAASAAANAASPGGEVAPQIESEPVPDTPAPTAVVRNVTVQFASPDAAAFDAALAGVRAAPGVRGLAVTSTAMGGTSVMSVTFGGTPEELAASLRSRGFRVNQSGNTLAISR